MITNDRTHISSLDGLRGLAILMVLFAHFNGEAILKEYYPIAGPIFTKIVLFGLRGVDLFFVLSGYLITTILLNSRCATRYYINFYTRRFLRIFPVYYLSLVLVFFIFPYIFTFDAAAIDISKRQLWLWGYVGNIPLFRFNWDSSNIFKLGHFWSLAVEQHFYMFWPFVVINFDQSKLKKICLSWFAASSIAGIIDAVTNFNIFWLHWSSITHSGGLALGSYCAIIIGEHINLRNIAIKILYTCVTVVIPLVFIPRAYHEKIINSLVLPLCWVIFSSLLIILISSPPKSKLTAFFNNKLLVQFGLYSYGIYIFHNIFLPLFEQIFPRKLLIDNAGLPFIGILLYFLCVIAASYSMAFVSWHAYEKHFLKLKTYFR